MKTLKKHEELTDEEKEKLIALTKERLTEIHLSNANIVYIDLQILELLTVEQDQKGKIRKQLDLYPTPLEPVERFIDWLKQSGKQLKNKD